MRGKENDGKAHRQHKHNIAVGRRKPLRDGTQRRQLGQALAARLPSTFLASLATTPTKYLELNVALGPGHVEGALERGDAVARTGSIPAAKLITLINLSQQEIGWVES